MDTTSRLMVPSGYDRRRNPPLLPVRPLTKAEVLRLTPGSEVFFISSTGQLRRLRINGKVRTWKRSPSRIEVPVKYGLYEYATMVWSEVSQVLHSWGSPSVIAVSLLEDPPPDVRL